MSEEPTFNVVDPALRAAVAGRLSRPLRRLAAIRWSRPASALGCAVVAIGFLCWPLLFTSSAMEGDWRLHLWYIWHQSLTLRTNHQPSLFVNDQAGVFYPAYAFYNGTIYALAALLGLLLGDAPVRAYILTYVLGFAAAYGGWYWLARMAGLGRWLAQAPGLLFVTSAYYLTNVYGRGDWAEFIAVSAIPLLAAAVLHVLLADRLSLLAAGALAGSALVFFGSHNITMLWGGTTLGVLGAATAIAIPQARRRITTRGVVRVARLLVPAALVSAWYLLPAIAYARRTSLISGFPFAHSLRETLYLVSAKNLFTFSRATVSPSLHHFTLALPVLALIWVLLGIAISLRLSSDEPWRRALWIFAAAAFLIGVVMTHPALELDLPAPYAVIQFAYRLESYVLLTLSAAVLAILVIAQRWPGRWRMWSWSVLIVLIASGLGAIQQVDHYPRSVNRNTVLASSNPPVDAKPEGKLGDYNDITLPLLDPVGAPEIRFPPAAIRDDSVAIAVNLPAGEVVRSNLEGAPYFVEVTGATVIGRTSKGLMVLRVGPHPGTSAQRISLHRAATLPIVLGQWIARLALVFLAASLAVAVVVRLRAGARRRGGLTLPRSP